MFNIHAVFQIYAIIIIIIIIIIIKCMLIDVNKCSNPRR